MYFSHSVIIKHELSLSILSLMFSINRAVGPGGPFFPSCLPGTLLNTATYAQALSQVATLKGKKKLFGWNKSRKSIWIIFKHSKNLLNVPYFKNIKCNDECC